MSTIKPYDIEDIKELVKTFNLPEILEPGIPANWPNRRLTRMVLAWAHERARGNRQHWLMSFQVGEYDFSRKDWTDADWLNEVLDEISWPEDQRGDF